MAAVKCQHCNDTGMSPGSANYDCARCDAATERTAFEKSIGGPYQDYDATHMWNAYLRGKAAGAAQAWQPIETAPKDGTSVLLFTPEGMIEACWNYGWELAACYATYDGAGGVALHCQPTYWMPLPAAPNPQSYT